jgi:hypothetical protein
MLSRIRTLAAAIVTWACGAAAVIVIFAGHTGDGKIRFGDDAAADGRCVATVPEADDQGRGSSSGGEGPAESRAVRRATAPSAEGEPRTSIACHGKVIDDAGHPVPGAVVHFWTHFVGWCGNHSDEDHPHPFDEADIACGHHAWPPVPWFASVDAPVSCEYAAITGRDGRFRWTMPITGRSCGGFTVRKNGWFELAVSCVGGLPGSPKFAADADAELGIFKLTKAAQVEIAWLDRTGRPATGIDCCEPVSLTMSVPAETGVQRHAIGGQRHELQRGIARFGSIAPGVCEFIVTSNQGSFVSPPVRLAAGETYQLRFQTSFAPEESTLVVAAATYYGVPPPDPSRVELRPKQGGTALHPQWHERGYIFYGLREGIYELRVDDPRFRDVASLEVSPGHSGAMLFLKGDCDVQVLATDRATGEAIPSLRGDIRYIGSLPPDDTERFELAPLCRGLPATSYRIAVGAEGYECSVVAVHDLHPGETRVVQVSLDPRVEPRGTARIAGRVSGVDAGAPFRVNCYKLRAGETRLPLDPDSRREADFAAPGSDDGTFSLDGLPPGRYSVVAVNGSRYAAVHGIELGPAESSTALQLAFERASLTGRVMLHPDDRGRGGSVVARSAFGRESAELAEDGTYQLDSLGAGAWQIVVSPTRDSEDTFAGTVVLSGGEIRRMDLDATGFGTGEIRVRMTCNGQPAPHGAVRAIRSGAGEFESPPAECDGDGVAVLRAIPAGTYSLTATSRGGAWVWTRPETVDVRRGETSQTDLDVPLARGAIEFTDASGSPVALASVELCYISAPDPDYLVLQRRARSSRFEVELPPGAIRVRAGIFESSQTIPWSSSASQAHRVRLDICR